MLYTLSELSTYQEDIKKSRFLALGGSVQSGAEALQFIASHSIAAATHNCWAYRVGHEYRFNDDGEPGGTAGKPILQAIDGQDCDRVAVLVVRWFGGVKLGPGGLIRAYAGAAAQCLRSGTKIELLDEVVAVCRCAFADIALVQSKFAVFQVRIEAEAFDSKGVSWRLAVPRRQMPLFMEQFTDLTRGQGRFELDPG